MPKSRWERWLDKANRLSRERYGLVMHSQYLNEAYHWYKDASKAEEWAEEVKRKSKNLPTIRLRILPIVPEDPKK